MIPVNKDEKDVHGDFQINMCTAAHMCSLEGTLTLTDLELYAFSCFFSAAATSEILMQSAGPSLTLIPSSIHYSMIQFILFIHQFLHVLLLQSFDPFLVNSHFT